MPVSRVGFPYLKALPAGRVLPEGNRVMDGQPSSAPLHAVDCTCADDDPRNPRFEGMRCMMREDWFEGDDPTDKPPPRIGYQHDPDRMARWARARRTSILPWIRRRAHQAIRYAIYHREIELGWRWGSLTEWVWR